MRQDEEEKVVNKRRNHTHHGAMREFEAVGFEDAGTETLPSKTGSGKGAAVSNPELKTAAGRASGRQGPGLTTGSRQ